MMARLLLLLSSLAFLAAPAVAQRRSVMEGLPASANTVMVDTATVRLGVGLSTPTARLHVHDGDIRISTSAGYASRGIIFQDGTTQTTAGSAVSVSLSSMSLTTITALTSVFVCYGTTVAFTPAGNLVSVRAKASGRTSGNGSTVDMAVFRWTGSSGGTFIPPATASIADSRLRAVSADSTNEGDLTFNKLVSVTAGQETKFCMAGRGTGSPNWYCDNAVCYLEISDL